MKQRRVSTTNLLGKPSSSPSPKPVINESVSRSQRICGDIIRKLIAEYAFCGCRVTEINDFDYVEDKDHEPTTARKCIKSCRRFESDDEADVKEDDEDADDDDEEDDEDDQRNNLLWLMSLPERRIYRTDNQQCWPVTRGKTHGCDNPFNEEGGKRRKEHRKRKKLMPWWSDGSHSSSSSDDSDVVEESDDNSEIFGSEIEGHNGQSESELPTFNDSVIQSELPTFNDSVIRSELPTFNDSVIQSDVRQIKDNEMQSDAHQVNEVSGHTSGEREDTTLYVGEGEYQVISSSRIRDGQAKGPPPSLPSSPKKVILVTPGKEATNAIVTPGKEATKAIITPGKEATNAIITPGKEATNAIITEKEKATEKRKEETKQTNIKVTDTKAADLLYRSVTRKYGPSQFQKEIQPLLGSALPLGLSSGILFDGIPKALEAVDYAMRTRQRHIITAMLDAGCLPTQLFPTDLPVGDMNSQLRRRRIRNSLTWIAEAALSRYPIDTFLILLDASHSATYDALLYFVAKQGSLECLKRLITKLEEQKMPHILNASYNGLIPLCRAAQSTDTRRLRLLLAAGADVNCQPTKTSMTPLLAATKVGNVEAAKILLEAGANVNCWMDESPLPMPLFHAVHWGDLPLVELLCKWNPDLQLRQPSGENIFRAAENALAFAKLKKPMTIARLPLPKATAATCERITQILKDLKARQQDENSSCLFVDYFRVSDHVAANTSIINNSSVTSHTCPNDSDRTRITTQSSMAPERQSRSKSLKEGKNHVTFYEPPDSKGDRSSKMHPIDRDLSRRHHSTSSLSTPPFPTSLHTPSPPAVASTTSDASTVQFTGTNSDLSTTASLSPRNAFAGEGSAAAVCLPLDTADPSSAAPATLASRPRLDSRKFRLGFEALVKAKEAAALK